jgi:hypothetical protein
VVGRVAGRVVGRVVGRVAGRVAGQVEGQVEGLVADPCTPCTLPPTARRSPHRRLSTVGSGQRRFNEPILGDPAIVALYYRVGKGARVAAEQFLVPTEGLSAWVNPDPAESPVAQLAPGTPVRVGERRGAWAQVHCTNGWSGWVDGRVLIPDPQAAAPVAPVPPPPPPPPPAEPAWAPTHVVPDGGLDAWDAPDPTRPPVTHLQAGTQLTVGESHPNGWAHVASANGWQSWVDGRRLVAASANPVAAAPAAAGPRVEAPFGITMPPWWPAEVPVVPAAGAFLVIFGGFLPWLSFGFGSASAWDISLAWLLTGGSFAGGLKVGLLLLAVLAVGVPALNKRPLPPAVLPTMGLVAIGLALATLIRGLAGTTVLGSRISYDPSVGLFMTLAGGAILAIDRLRAWMERVRSRESGAA